SNEPPVCEPTSAVSWFAAMLIVPPAETAAMHSADPVSADASENSSFLCSLVVIRSAARSVLPAQPPPAVVDPSQENVMVSALVGSIAPSAIESVGPPVNPVSVPDRSAPPCLTLMRYSGCGNSVEPASALSLVPSMTDFAG